LGQTTNVPPLRAQPARAVHAGVAGIALRGGDDRHAVATRDARQARWTLGVVVHRLGAGVRLADAAPAVEHPDEPGWVLWVGWDLVRERLPHVVAHRGHDLLHELQILGRAAGQEDLQLVGVDRGQQIAELVQRISDMEMAGRHPLMVAWTRRRPTAAAADQRPAGRRSSVKVPGWSPGCKPR
jgi:hypothetical protein